ncbi:unnamed protein product [Strongylus vulgaris]|uniref:Uncharacterized protein n=1 Tax=Strongylus vulgaris TaxID=40348 RepID=A0A3P7J2E2_STRVU|nr:unnamed protein product [Strongylus vulgaris]
MFFFCRTSGRRRFSSSSSSEDFVANTSDETSSSSSETSSSETPSTEEDFEPHRTTPYYTRARGETLPTDEGKQIIFSLNREVYDIAASEPPRTTSYHTRGRDQRNRNRVSRRRRRSSSSSSDNEDELGEDSEGEEVRGDSESIIMDNHDNDNDVQVIEENANLLNIVNRPKRRRTDNFATDDEEAKPSVSTEPASSAHATLEDDSGDDGCTICRNAVCPTCKAKTSIKDVRKHYTNAVKVTDTTEVEMLRNSNAALHIKVSGLEVELARKDREIVDLKRRLQDGKTHDIISATPQLVVQSRGGRMFMNPERKESLTNGIDRNSSFVNAIPCIAGDQEWLCFRLTNQACFCGEDKRAIVSMNGAIRRQWKMPHEKPVWTGCWTSANKVALGLGDGRVFEYAVDSDSTEPIRDYTQGVGHLPIIFTGFDPASSTLLVASFKKLIAFRNEKVFPLLNNTDDQFDKMRSVSFDESSLHFAVTFSPGGRHPAISHRLYRLEVDDDNDEVRCIEMAQWLTECQMSSTMWSNCLFSLKNSLFSVVFNEDQKRFDAHDWSGRRTDVSFFVSMFYQFA